jgi:hypothetical protein
MKLNVHGARHDLSLEALDGCMGKSVFHRNQISRAAFNYFYGRIKFVFLE